MWHMNDHINRKHSVFIFSFLHMHSKLLDYLVFAHVRNTSNNNVQLWSGTLTGSKAEASDSSGWWYQACFKVIKS